MNLKSLLEGDVVDFTKKQQQSQNTKKEEELAAQQIKAMIDDTEMFDEINQAVSVVFDRLIKKGMSEDDAITAVNKKLGDVIAANDMMKGFKF